MKRAHRRWHRRIWLLLAPVALAMAGVAVLWPTVEPVNGALPPAIAAPAAAQGN